MAFLLVNDTINVMFQKRAKQIIYYLIGSNNNWLNLSLKILKFKTALLHL